MRNRDISLVYNHATQRADERFGLNLNIKALKQLSIIAGGSQILGEQIYAHIPKRTLRIIHIYKSPETRKLNPDIKKDDIILAVCGNTTNKQGHKKLRIITFLPEEEVDGKIYRSTYNCENMKW